MTVILSPECPASVLSEHFVNSVFKGARQIKFGSWEITENRGNVAAVESVSPHHTSAPSTLDRCVVVTVFGNLYRNKKWPDLMRKHTGCDPVIPPHTPSLCELRPGKQDPSPAATALNWTWTRLSVSTLPDGSRSQSQHFITGDVRLDTVARDILQVKTRLKQNPRSSSWCVFQVPVIDDNSKCFSKCEQLLYSELFNRCCWV